MRWVSNPPRKNNRWRKLQKFKPWEGSLGRGPKCRLWRAGMRAERGSSCFDTFLGSIQTTSENGSMECTDDVQLTSERRCCKRLGLVLGMKKDLRPYAAQAWAPPGKSSRGRSLGPGDGLLRKGQRKQGRPGMNSGGLPKTGLDGFRLLHRQKYPVRHFWYLLTAKIC